MSFKIFRFCVCLVSCAKGTDTLCLRIYNDKVLRIKYVRSEGVSTSHSRVPTEPNLPEENPPHSQCQLWQSWRDSRKKPLLHLSDYLSDPIAIKCGHNICCYCIRKSWVGLQDRFPCLVCHHKSNMRLRRMTKRWPSSSIPPRARGRGENWRAYVGSTSLFCEEDLEVFVHLHLAPWQSRLPHEVLHLKRRLRSDMEPSRKQMAIVLKLVATQERKPLELRER